MSLPGESDMTLSKCKRLNPFLTSITHMYNSGAEFLVSMWYKAMGNLHLCSIQNDNDPPRK